jgi:5-methylcytosine-specific restriction endonuclease McrA
MPNAIPKKKPQYGGKWKTVRLEVLARDKHKCQIAGSKCTTIADQVDHITPVAYGGAWWDLDNLRASCRNCNLGRIAKRKTQASRSW